ncbi:hypothetical protein C8R48DRAFT_770958 [Suillus tomentosus]|nr:hypothetical protein C8R48DRAFT_770958 [Suillus tomentosus]
MPDAVFQPPNLYYATVQPRPSMKKKVVQAIAGSIKSQHATHTGIVHGFSNPECEELAEELRNHYGLSAKHYHAGMGPTRAQHYSRSIIYFNLRLEGWQHPGKQLKGTHTLHNYNIVFHFTLRLQIFFMCPPPLSTYLVPLAFTTFLPVLHFYNMANTYSPGPHIPYHANALETPHTGSLQFAPAPSDVPAQLGLKAPA